MKSTLNEHEIRPTELFNRYLSLSRQDIQEFFSDGQWNDSSCPACDTSGNFAFDKLGFSYRECPQCWSLWVSPRPTFEAYVNFYSRSASSRYWAETFYPAVESTRREKLWRPKARMVQGIAHNSPETYNSLIDIGGGSGTFAEEFEALTEISVTVIEPSPESAAQCRSRGITVINSFFEKVASDELPEGPSIFTSFELFEHVHNPREWMTNIAELMRSGDLLIVTTLSSLGLDIQTLWDNSDSVSPPHHINFLNPRSMAIVGTAVGLEIVQIFTPGVLDLDIMRNNRSKITDRFWGSILDSASDAELSRWQTFISEHSRSSHMWAVFSKP